MDFDCVGAVLERVVLLPALARKLALLADGDEGHAPGEGQDRPQDEAFGLQADDVRVVAGAWWPILSYDEALHGLHQLGEDDRLDGGREDVEEVDPYLGEVLVEAQLRQHLHPEAFFVGGEVFDRFVGPIGGGVDHS